MTLVVVLSEPTLKGPCDIGKNFLRPSWNSMEFVTSLTTALTMLQIDKIRNTHYHYKV